ncbi:hypothetical protein ACLOJK_000703 [Asimina triloba]
MFGSVGGSGSGSKISQPPTQSQSQKPPHTNSKAAGGGGGGNAGTIWVNFEDLYGFPVEGSVDDVNVVNEVMERVKQQGRAWWDVEAAKGPNWFLPPPQQHTISSFFFTQQPIPITPSALSNSITLKKLIRKGIPPSLRPKVWLAISGATKKRSTVPDTYYHDLTHAVHGKVSPATTQIDHDLPRTFPGHPWLDTPEAHASLRRVLTGYSFRDSDVGYCQGAERFSSVSPGRLDAFTRYLVNQAEVLGRLWKVLWVVVKCDHLAGLNYVAALLLLVMETEEDSFWMLAVLLENVLVNDCYTKDLSGCHVDQRVFKDLLVKKCPRIAAHLEAMEFDVSLVTTEWFLCLFAKSLPSETTLRVWDILFNEGAKVLFHVALAIFKMKEEELLSAHQIVDVLNILHNTARRLFNPDELLTVAFDKIGSMTTNALTKQRKKQESMVIAELDQKMRQTFIPLSTTCISRVLNACGCLDPGLLVPSSLTVGRLAMLKVIVPVWSSSCKRRNFQMMGDNKETRIFLWLLLRCLIFGTSYSIPSGFDVPICCWWWLYMSLSCHPELIVNPRRVLFWIDTLIVVLMHTTHLSFQDVGRKYKPALIELNWNKQKASPEWGFENPSVVSSGECHGTILSKMITWGTRDSMPFELSRGELDHRIGQVLSAMNLEESQLCKDNCQNNNDNFLIALHIRFKFSTATFISYIKELATANVDHLPCMRGNPQQEWHSSSSRNHDWCTAQNSWNQYIVTYKYATLVFHVQPWRDQPSATKVA